MLKHTRTKVQESFFDDVNKIGFKYVKVTAAFVVY